MISKKDIKRDIVEQYDREARDLDNVEWYEKGADARVPERLAGRYFVKRKVSMALKLYGRGISDNTRALEIGCSFGHMTALLARQFSQLTAVDISSKSVQIAQKRLHLHGLSHVDFRVDDAESLLTISDGSFDVVFSFSTIRFCPYPHKAMAAIRKKLRPGGVAIVDFPNRHSPWHNRIKTLLGIKPHIHDRLFSAAEAAALFKESNFKVEHVESFLFTSRRLPSVLLPASAILDLVMERIPPLSRFAGIIMIRGVKE